MDVRFSAKDVKEAAREAADALVVLWPQGGTEPALAADEPLAQWVQQAQETGLLAEGVGQCALTLGAPPGQAAMAQARIVVVATVGTGGDAEVRKATLAAFAALKAAKPASVHLHLGLLGACSAATVRVACLAAWEASYEYATTKPSAKGRTLKQLSLSHPDLPHGPAWVEEAVAWAHGVEWAREWANRPANHATPSALAEAALQLARHPRMQVEVLGPKEVAKLGMGAFLAVAQGSEEPLRFIVVRYNGAAKADAPVVWVGKGITFDTGGISIKPAAEMDEMKFDMAGAASVLGALEAIGRLQPSVNVVGLVAACENMPSGRAVKPGDVVTSLSGQTIEILNTDAEGRLLLCDALAYAKRFKPRLVIDVATLTGACVIALGHTRSGLYSNDDALREALFKAGEAALDPCWPMPLDEEYAEGLKSHFADVANVAGRPAGSVTAAKFLQKFVPDCPWAHLDIAGTAWKSGPQKGATGRPVGLLLAHVLAQASAGASEKGQAAAPTKRRGKKSA